MKSIPDLRKEKKIIKIHGEELIDEYAWIKQNNWQEVLNDPGLLNKEVQDYLKNENTYVESAFSHLKSFKKKIFDELKGRIKDKDSSVPSKDGAYSYYSKYLENSEYPQFIRIENQKKNEEVIFDAQLESKHHKFFTLSDISHSHDHKLLAYGIDTKGNEKYDIFIKDLSSNKVFSEKIENSTGPVIWHPNNKIFFYTKLDENLRPNKIYSHEIGSDPKQDTLVYEEKDSAFFCSPSLTQDKRFLLIRTGDHQTSEYWFQDLFSKENIKCFKKRVEKEEYEIDHSGDHFFILTNKDDCKNFKIEFANDREIKEKNWKAFIRYDANKLLLNFCVLKSWIIVLFRTNGLNQILVKKLDAPSEHLIKFEEETYELDFIDGYEFDTDWLRFSYSSPISPKKIFDYNCLTKEKVLKKTQEIPSGFDESKYVCKKVMVDAQDKEKIPLTIFYHKDTKINGSAPLLLYGYGSYGITIPDSFSPHRFSLINRGFVYAIAHIRGGREKGQQWYENGKLLNKKNTFFDFISCAEYLCKNQYTSKGKIIAQGGSAGGLLMGFIANEKPDLFLGIIAQVPFVDICNTMLDEDLPLTVTEIPEWGNLKQNINDFKYIRSYSPYDNVKKQSYPNMLVTGGITDPRVTYWEMTKWVAKIRDHKTDNNLLFLFMNMDAGHAGASGRYDYLNEIVLEYTFALKIADKIDT